MSQLDLWNLFGRGAHDDAEQSDASARRLLAHLAGVLGLEDLRTVDLLDVGCGTKFTQALINHQIPIGNYTGVDVHKPLIEALQLEVDDPRFDFHHFNVRNERYAPSAPPMAPDSDLGVGDREFDLACLFSVFTHLDPTDFASMLRIVRRHVKSSGLLYFTAFVDELTEDGFGLADGLDRTLRASVESGDVPTDLADVGSASDANGNRIVEPYRDLQPDKPLTWPMYARDYATRLVLENGWDLVDLRPPTAHTQHQFICRPKIGSVGAV